MGDLLRNIDTITPLDRPPQTGGGLVHRAPKPETRGRLVVETGGFLYDSDALQR